MYKERMYPLVDPQYGAQRLPMSVYANMVLRYIYGMSFAIDRPNKALLDYGCGAGYGTFLLAPGFEEAWGYDPSPEAIEYARKYYRAWNIHFTTDESTIRPQNPFDFVVMSEVIEHIREDDVVPVLKRIRARMAPKGILFGTTPIPTRTDGTSDNPYHVREYHPQQVKDALTSAGFCNLLIIPPGSGARYYAFCGSVV